MASVRLEGIKKVYENGFVAVHGADFEVHDGEFVVLVGPSGCGKSTTLRMVAGLESISGGNLFIGERQVNEVPPKDRDIAMVFQNYALYPHMTVFDNMAFGLKLRKYAKGEIRSRVEQAADILGISPILDRKPKQLSGGQRQRVAVGRAIVRKPQVFLFDEPLSNLDAKLRVQMRTEISKLHRTLAATMIYVTHDQVEAMTMGDRIVVMKDGHIQQIETPLNLYDNPVNKFVAGFIGSPSMNFMSGRIQDNVFVSHDGNVTISLNGRYQNVTKTHSGRDIYLGVRPEDVSLSASGGNAFTLEVLEPMGNEVVIYARGGDDLIVGRIDPHLSIPQPGDPVNLSFNAERLHFFDGETEAALRVETPSEAARI